MTNLSDKRLWRKALSITHPDRVGGDEEVFKFLVRVKDKIEEIDPSVERVTGKGRDRRKTVPTPPVDTTNIRPWWQQLNRR